MGKQNSYLKSGFICGASYRHLFQEANTFSALENSFADFEGENHTCVCRVSYLTISCTMLAVVFFGSKESDRNGTQGQEEAGWQAALFNTWAWKE
jgi:hypothetical protein